MTPSVLRFTGSHAVDVVAEHVGTPGPADVLVQTLYSGISAGTELTAYRGTNPYLTKVWSPAESLFREGNTHLAYPLSGWGYSEVGTVLEVGAEVTSVRPGDVVWGIWGHRTHAVLDGHALAGHVVPGGVDPRAGTFSRVASVALNAVLCGQAGIGSVVAVVGLGVIGLLATRFAVLSGATVIAVDPIATRRERALALGADEALPPSVELAAMVRELTAGKGADVAIELSGRDDALHEAIRTVGPEGVVVAAGFYQGCGTNLRLGEEFHHNRVRLQSSQIGAVPVHLAARWSRERLVQAATARVLSGDLDVLSLVSHQFPLHRAADAYRLLDTSGDQALQVLLEMDGR